MRTFDFCYDKSNCELSVRYNGMLVYIETVAETIGVICERVHELKRQILNGIYPKGMTTQIEIVDAIMKKYPDPVIRD